MLKRASVLVVEDQSYIALDLALAIEDADGEVIGPAASVKAALTLLAIKNVDGAILDLNLPDGDCSPVVEVLAGRSVPFILQTGAGVNPGLAARFPNLVARIKPCVAAKLIEELEGMISDHKRTAEGKAAAS